MHHWHSHRSLRDHGIVMRLSDSFLVCFANLGRSSSGRKSEDVFVGLSWWSRSPERQDQWTYRQRTVALDVATSTVLREWVEQPHVTAHHNPHLLPPLNVVGCRKMLTRHISFSIAGGNEHFFYSSGLFHKYGTRVYLILYMVQYKYTSRKRSNQSYIVFSSIAAWGQ